MALKYVNIPLYSDAYYSYTIALESNSYTLEFTYSDRSEAYFISLFDEDNTLLVGGERLVPNYPMFKDYPLPNLTGWFWMEEIADIFSQPYITYPDKLDQYYYLYYVYDDGV